MTGAEIFFISKALIALAGVVLLIIHMSISWKEVILPGQRWRYLVLLGFSFLAVAGSTRQVAREDFEIFPERVFALLLYTALVFTIIESIREHRHGSVREHYKED